MKYYLVTIITLITLSAVAQTGSKNFIDQNYIEVSGKAEMEVSPDQIFLKVLINEKDFKGKSSLEALEKSMLEALISIGLDPSEDISIMDMASNFKNYWIKNPKIYSMKIYQVECKDANTAGMVFRDLEELGISNITIDRIEHSEIERFRREVKIEAIKAAKEKAGSLAEAIDQTAGRAILIQEQNFHVFKTMQGTASNIVVRGYGSTNQTELDPLPEIEFEKIKLEYTILARFELK
jgi:hypothetical protein